MKTVPLSELIVTLQSGARPKGGIRDGGGDVASLGAEHLSSDGGFNFTKVKRVPREFYESMKKGRVANDDILIVKDGATTGKVSFVSDEFPFDEAAINEHLFKVAVDTKKAEPRFVFRYLQSPKGQAEIMKDFRGATVGGIGRTFVEKVLLPDLTLAEQRRIAAILDKADAIRRKRKEALSLAGEFLKSMFLEMFGDPVNNSKGLPTKPLSWFGEIVTGNTPPRSNTRNYGSYIEWIKSDNINTPEHFLTEAKEYLSQEGTKVGRTVPQGSILVICIAGSPASIGRAAMADREVALNQQINAITPVSDVDQHFLYAQFVVGQRLVQEASTKSMKGMVSKGKFKEIQFLAPEPTEQRKFGKIFRKYLENVARLTSAHNESQDMFGSLSPRAFRGEI